MGLTYAISKVNWIFAKKKKKINKIKKNNNNVSDYFCHYM